MKNNEILDIYENDNSNNDDFYKYPTIFPPIIVLSITYALFIK